MDKKIIIGLTCFFIFTSCEKHDFIVAVSDPHSADVNSDIEDPLLVQSALAHCMIDRYVKIEKVSSETKIIKGKSKKFAKPKSNKKINICHVPPGNPQNRRTLSVNVKSLRAHLKKGSLVGSCKNYSEIDLEEHSNALVDQIENQNNQDFSFNGEESGLISESTDTIILYEEALGHCDCADDALPFAD